AGGMSASSRIEFVGDVSSIVRAAHQRLEVPGPRAYCWILERLTLKPERPWLPLVGSSFLQAVKNRDPVSWRAKREKEMEEALELWEAFMLSWPSHLAVVSQLASLSESARPRMVRDLLGHKAPSTLLKRYRALRGYFDYLSGFRVSFPGSESDCYGYLCHLQDKGKAASARKGVLEALAFARFVIGLVEVGNLNESRRCHGNAKVVSNRDREQASALKVSELQRLRHALEHDPSLWNRVFSGCSLMCTYGRSRWEDLMRTDRILWDYDSEGNLAFIECSVDIHKTRNAKQFKGTLLPFVAPALGVVDVNLGALWLQARKDLGLKDPRDGGAMMPAPDSDMQITDRSLESDEAGAWLRYVLYGLRPFEAEQVAAANAVYRACVRILFRAYETGALISIENPVRSWLWPLLACLVKAFDHAAFTDWFFALTDYDFDACVFGSRRAKAASLPAYKRAQLLRAEVRASAQHQH
ncbi:unnamed protein product, partial [Symbiodinium pilosum]